MSGVFDGWYALIMNTYRNSDDEFSLTDNDCSWIVSLNPIGMTTGSAIAIVSFNKIGCCLMMFLAAILTMFSSSSVALFKIVFVHFLARFLIGISSGMNSLMRPIWVGENSSPHTRPIFGSIINFFSNFGILLSCLLGTYCSYEISSKVILGLSLMGFASTILSKEPPQRLIARGRESDGENQFFWLRDRNEITKKEFDEIKTKMKKINDEHKSSFEFIRTPSFPIVCILTALVYSVGRVPLGQLAPIVLMPTEHFSSSELCILLFLARLIGSTVSPFFIDRFHRRTLWIVSSILCFLFHTITAVLFYLLEVNIKITAHEWVIFGSVTAFMATNVIFIVPLHNIALAELLPQKQKVVSGFYASSIISDVVSVILGQTFLRTASHFGMKTNFIFFAISCVALSLYSYFYIPETKGLSLIDIEKLFEKRKHNEA